MPHDIKLLGKLSIQDNTQKPSPIMKSQKGVALLTYLIVLGNGTAVKSSQTCYGIATSTAKALQSLRELLRRVRLWIPDEL